jgi:hypothetical protein
VAPTCLVLLLCIKILFILLSKTSKLSEEVYHRHPNFKAALAACLVCACYQLSCFVEVYFLQTDMLKLSTSLRSLRSTVMSLPLQLVFPGLTFRTAPVSNLTVLVRSARMVSNDLVLRLLRRTRTARRGRIPLRSTAMILGLIWSQRWKTRLLRRRRWRHDRLERLFLASLSSLA